MASCAQQHPAQRANPKGRPAIRKCPDDFDVIFVEQGRDGCVDWYRAHKLTVTRWLEDRGKARLIEARAAFVSHQRKNGKWMTRSSNLVEVRKSLPTRLEAIRDPRKVNPTLARHAAQHLRIIRHGGFIVSIASNGDWRVGTRLLSAAQLVDFAVAKGFDRVAVMHLEGTIVVPAPAERSVDHEAFPCGHPKTPSNVRKRSANGRERCRMCNRKYNLASISRVRAARRAALHADSGRGVVS